MELEVFGRERILMGQDDDAKVRGSSLLFAIISFGVLLI
jgi:hypothetical protein